MGHLPLGPVGPLVEDLVAAVDHDIAAEAVAVGVAGHLGRPPAHGVGIGDGVGRADDQVVFDEVVLAAVKYETHFRPAAG